MAASRENPKKKEAPPAQKPQTATSESTKPSAPPKRKASKVPELIARLVPFVILGIYYLFKNAPSPTESMIEALWEQHLAHEFDPAQQSTEATMATMIDDEPSVVHVPTLVGGTGKAALAEFYENSFIFKNPPIAMKKLKRTLSVSGRSASLVDELVISLDHTTEVDWLLPAVAPTGKSVAFPLVASVDFFRSNATDDAATFGGWRIARERIYWDQASVLKQIGLLDGFDAPPGIIIGVEQSEAVLKAAGNRKGARGDAAASSRGGAAEL